MNGGQRCDPEELRTLFLFERLTEEQLAWICEIGTIRSYGAETIYSENTPAEVFYVLLDGEVVLTRRVGDDDVELIRTSQRGVYAGAVQAYLGDRVPQVYSTSFRTSRPSRFLEIGAEDFGNLVGDWFPMALHLLEGLFLGMENTREVIAQRERLMALGSLSAGLTHELNNPAASALRATSVLRERVAALRDTIHFAAGLTVAPEALERLVDLQEEALRRSAHVGTLGPLEVSDREDALADWLEDHGVQGSWELAATFVQAGVGEDWLKEAATAAPDGDINGVLHWLANVIVTEQLMNEIQDSTSRISTLVEAASQYSQLDRAPYQEADVRTLLDSTLVMLAQRIGAGITVEKTYDPDLPMLQCYPAELNQVWTNLIDNAVAAMEGRGRLTVTAVRERDTVLVEIGDTGPGVPRELRGRIFEPFFTTKPVGSGTGLGLDISWRIVVNKHHGSLKLVSDPATAFQVRLPLRQPAEDDGAGPAPAQEARAAHG
ncbi:MAG: Sensor histidine kinase [uncultured Arthrobacter sp.]|uniref:histidine kinase n=1 Tax=uncultured Arthrobacter sp. TaxID=114050 RepID=A0A6J4IHS5_9MICC|nr:ATP-binding protein [uncultured Arthrobacter sp.]CAA9250789.1 MAG: Sensor histidine kinase [uncultured Arthrobacter sp.]